MSGVSRLIGGSLLVCVLATAGAARAEPAPGPEGPARPASVAFGDRFGILRLARLLDAASPSERGRGIQRLAALGSEPALDRLAAFAFERRAQLSGREWVIMARALAPLAANDKSQLVLATLLNQAPGEGVGPDEVALITLARGVAALALARDGSAASLQVLGQALQTRGPSAAAAAMALEAHPPAELKYLLELRGEPTVELARLLGALGDQRAFHHLRAWVRGASAEVRAASAIALTELGHLETVPLATQWLTHELPVLQDAALRILMLAQDPRASRTLARQLSAGEVDAELERRALQFPSGELLEVALAQLSRAGAAETWWWTLLGRIGGRTAAERLEAGLGRAETAFVAAHALSRLAGSHGHDALVRALDRGVALPLSLRAAAARARFGQERFEGLQERLEALVRSDVPSERAAGAWGLSLMGGQAALAELESGDEARILAAANNALLFDDAVFERAAALLSARAPGHIRTALAFCLLRPSGQRAVTTASLRSLAAEGGLGRPLALRVLASRGDPDIGSFVEGYVHHPDPLLRAHVARGLGDSREPRAIGVLTGRFEFETDEDVRHAIVCALSSRRGRAVTRTLELASTLDPSARVRSAARLALGGARLGNPPAGSELLWAELRSGAGEATGARNGALLDAAPGLAFPVFGDAGGLLIVAGVNAQHLGIRLQ